MILVLLLQSMASCDHKHGATTKGLVVNLRTGYEGYLSEGGKPILEKIDNRAFIKLLAGGNSKGIVFIELPDSELDAEGYVIDTWKTRLKIEPVIEPAAQIEIRSAGADRTFGTPDDVYVVSGKRGE